MKTLLVYATNSGSTLEVANYISGEFSQKGKEITVADAREITPSEFNNYDLVILGSPTWGEGNVHDLYLRIFEKATGMSFKGKKFAIFGLGDSTYEHFCTSADHLAEFVKKLEGDLVIEPLKINNFYFNQQEELPKITEWSQKILSTFS